LDRSCALSARSTNSSAHSSTLAHMSGLIVLDAPNDHRMRDTCDVRPYFMRWSPLRAMASNRLGVRPPPTATALVMFATTSMPPVVTRSSPRASTSRQNCGLTFQFSCAKRTS
jgi:hypothetical protein